MGRVPIEVADSQALPATNDEERAFKAPRPTGTNGKNLYRWGVVAALTAVYACNNADRQLLALLAEPVKQDLHLSDTQLGLLTGAVFAVFYTILGIPAAWLADRKKRIYIVAVACGLWSLFTAACGFVGSFFQLALARSGVAVGEAGGTAPSFSIISDYFAPSSRGKAISIFLLGAPIGTSLGGAFGAWVTTDWGWRAAFIAMGMLGLVFAIGLPLLIREPERGKLDLQPPGATVPVLQTWLLFLRSPGLRVTLIASCLAATAHYALIVWTPPFLIRSQGASLMDVGMYYGAAAGTTVTIGILLSGVLLDRFLLLTPRAYCLVPAIAFTLALPFFVLAIWVTHWQWSILLLAITQMMTVAFQTPAVAAVQNIVPASQRTSATAFLMVCMGLTSMALGPLLIGTVSDLANADFGDQSLRVALIALVPVFLMSAGLFYRAAYLTRKTA